MLTALLTTICVLGVVIVGLLIMTQLISLEQLGQGIWRGFVTIVLVAVSMWLLKTAVLPIFVGALVWLKKMTAWAAIVMLSAILLILAIRVFISGTTN